MKKYYNISLRLLSISLLMVSFGKADAQSFKKGSFMVSMSGGSTTANYSTKNINPESSGTRTKKSMDGIRDPLMLEYGLTKRIGIGISTGMDIFKVDPSVYYGFTLPNCKKVEMYTSELNLDFCYHIYNNDVFDLSTFSSAGTFSVFTSGIEPTPPNDENLSDDWYSYNYKAKGSIFRTGARAKLYVWKRVGFMTMFSVYAGNSSPKRVKGNTVGNNYSTRISGYATEFGLCFRFF